MWGWGLSPAKGTAGRPPQLYRPASHHSHPLKWPSQGHGHSHGCRNLGEYRATPIFRRKCAGGNRHRRLLRRAFLRETY